MNCLKCGAVIPDGSLYCEMCGEDIHIVPDFEPEIEYSIKETLSSLAEDIMGGESSRQAEGEESVHKEPLKQKKGNKALLIGGTLLITLLVMIGIGVGTYFYRFNSLDYQLGRAAQCLSNQQYEEAIGYYERALLLDDKNIAVKFLLADVYYAADRKADAVSMLSEIIFIGENEGALTTEDLTKAYTKIINIYKEQENYLAARDLLNSCGNPEIFNLFQEYSSKEPEFSYQEGDYDFVIPLKLTATAAGTIYYTMDGSEPTQNSEVYTTPIFLETGDYTVSAVFINDYGIASDVVAKKYHVEVLRPGAPEISAESGEYHSPMMIETEVPEGHEVYYTVDGSEPTENSNRYTRPIPMPLGTSMFQFIMLDENNLHSEVAVKNYKLELSTELSVEDAVYKVMEALVIRGKIYDFNGNSLETDGRYQYLFQYAVAVENAGDYYVIAEVIEDSDGVRDRTGTNYAVDVYTGDCYKVYLEENGKYRLESF